MLPLVRLLVLHASLLLWTVLHWVHTVLLLRIVLHRLCTVLLLHNWLHGMRTVLLLQIVLHGMHTVLLLHIVLHPLRTLLLLLHIWLLPPMLSLLTCRHEYSRRACCAFISFVFGILLPTIHAQIDSPVVVLGHLLASVMVAFY